MPLHIIRLDIDGSRLRDHIIGRGGSGVVIRRDDKAVKLPLLYTTPEPTEENISYFEYKAESSRESLNHEKDVYRRLGAHPGIVAYLDLSGETIQMELMVNGNLHEYLAQHRPSQTLQHAWCRDMAHALVHIHDRCVLVADIAARNVLLAVDLSIKICDFTESTILPLGTNMQEVDDNGYSIYTDMGELGAVMYQVVTGDTCSFDLFRAQPPGCPGKAAWPWREDLPSTQDIWLGCVIEKCWTKGAFQNARQLLEALDSIALEEAAMEKSPDVDMSSNLSELVDEANPRSAWDPLLHSTQEVQRP